MPVFLGYEKMRIFAKVAFVWINYACLGRKIRNKTGKYFPILFFPDFIQ